MEIRQKVRLEKQDNGTTKYEIMYYGDATSYLREAEVARQKEQALRANKKNEYKRVASVDWATAMRIKQEHGVDPFNLRTPAETRKYLRILQRDFPKYLTTNKRVYRPPAAGGRGRTKFASIPSECLK